MNNLLNPPRFDQALFTYDPTDRTYTAEASDLGPRRELFGRIYADACDCGLTLSHGERTATFYLDATYVDEEREVTHWKLKPTPETIRRIPTLVGVKVVIFND